MVLPVTDAEDGPQAADDARLFAVRDGVVADDVVADGLLVPGDCVGVSPLDGLDVALGGIGRGVVPLVAVFAQGDAGADRVADDVVLDDPAFAPVRADQADLLGGGRRPGRGRVPQGEAAHGDVVHARLVRIEHRLAHVDLDQLLVGIDALELRPDRGVLLVHLAEPERRVARGLQDLVQLGRLGQPVAVEIDGAGVMLAALGVEPVAADQVAVGIEAAEERIGQRHFPDVVLDLHPVLDDFRAFDLDLLAGRRLVDDAFRVGLAAARRVDAFAVDAFVHGDHVARLGQLGGALDRAQRRSLRAGVGVVAAGGDVELGGLSGRGEGDDAGEGDHVGSHAVLLVFQGWFAVHANGVGLLLAGRTSSVQLRGERVDALKESVHAYEESNSPPWPVVRRGCQRR